MPGPVLFCYDGSEGSRAAMAAAGELVAHPAPVVVLTIWQPAAVMLALAGGFGGGYLSDEDKVDWEQAQLAATLPWRGWSAHVTTAMTPALVSRRPRKAQDARSSRSPTSSTRG